MKHILTKQNKRIRGLLLLFLFLFLFFCFAHLRLSDLLGRAQYEYQAGARGRERGHLQEALGGPVEAAAKRTGGQASI